jgi:negative regulator of sigma E activity
MEKAAAVRAAAIYYWVKAQQWFTGTKGKVIAALVILAVVAGYAHHKGAAGKSELSAEIVLLKKQLADAVAKPAPQPEIPYWQCNGPKETRHPQCRDEDAEADTADRLSKAETAKANLEKKVKDYETQLARRPAKGGGHILSPADARSLSNIR